MMADKILHALDPSIEHSPAFLMALGRLVAESAVLEAQLDTFIWHLSSNDQRSAQILTADLDFRRKVDVLSALLEHHAKHDEVLRREAMAEVRACHGLYNERNDYIHGMWVPSANNEQRGLMRRSAKKGIYKFSVSDVPLEKLQKLAEAFNRQAGVISKLLLRYLMS